MAENDAISMDIECEQARIQLELEKTRLELAKVEQCTTMFAKGMDTLTQTTGTMTAAINHTTTVFAEVVKHGKSLDAEVQMHMVDAYS